MAKLGGLQLCVIYLLSLYYTIQFCFKLFVYYLRGIKFWKIKDRPIPPSKILTPEVGHHSYIQLKNIKMHYVEAGDKSKPLMVFMHGFPEFWYSWRHQLKEFHNDYWCVAVDMRGYGDTSKPPNVRDYKIADIAEDIKELVEALGRKKFIMIAHDWGGVVGWSFLDLYADMVEKYVIMNAPHSDAWDKLMEIDKTQFSKGWYVIFYQMPYFPELAVSLNDFELMDDIYAFGPNRVKNEEDIECYKYTYSKPGALTPPINYYRNLFTTDPTVKRPVEKEPSGLFIFGENDMALSIAYVDIMPEVVPNLKSKIIKGGSHYVQQDAPIAVNKAMREFLSEN